MRRRKAIILGAGIGGLTAAVTLRRAGLDVAVYERARELRPAGFGLSVMSNAVLALRGLGIELGLEDRGEVIEVFHILTPSGRPMRRIPFGELSAGMGAPSVCVNRADLQSALLEAAGDCPISLAKTATGYTTTERGVRVDFADGTTADGDLLIGADGIRSVVRAQLAGRSEPRQAGFVCWLSTYPFRHPRLTKGFNAQYWGRGQRFGLHDVGGGRAYWWGTKNMDPAQAQDWRGDKADIARLFAGWAEETQAAIEVTPMEAIVSVPAQDRPFLEHWGSGPVTLLGDAAHPMLPSLGQGGSTAMEDAVALARALAAHSDPVAGLRAYENGRRERTRRMVEESHALTAIEQVESPVGRLTRSAYIRFAPQSVMFRSYHRALRLPEPLQPGNPFPEHKNGGEPMSDAKSVVTRYVEALQARDVPTILETVSEDAEFWIAGSGPLSGTWRGRDRILGEFVPKMGELFDSGAAYDIDVSLVIGEGKHVVLECVTRSVTAKGEAYANPITSIFTVEDGKIVGMREYMDTGYFQRVLFGSETPATA